jgi:hypothetical protein
LPADFALNFPLLFLESNSVSPLAMAWRCWARLLPLLPLEKLCAERTPHFLPVVDLDSGVCLLEKESG